ncbi:MIP/aquaporin family protein [Streptomyces sp. NBC_01198]|uniref:MIP/aquaporin family protein n=1 Tax=Streptomyces sp. NBC_01198 TaxID=2903769 RepID=UPI002E11C4E3|nr:aquaporin [Streptomyces sp. NBC_01198]
MRLRNQGYELAPQVKLPEQKWHIKEACCEFIGTAVVLWAVISALRVLQSQSTPVAGWFSTPTSRVGFIGLTVGLCLVILLLSPLGRSSGGHLNPALTMALWLRRTLGWRDLISYTAAQIAGATTGVALSRVLYGPIIDRSPIHDGVLKPAMTYFLATLTEAGLTCVLLTTVLVFLSNRHLAPWCVCPSSILTALFIWWAGIASGASLSQARAIGPDIFVNNYPALSVYLVGPTMGGLAAAAIHFSFKRLPLTGKIRHDPKRSCTQRCALQHVR